jgi:hypothetical protein
MPWKNVLTSNHVGPTATPAIPVSIPTPMSAKTAMQVRNKRGRPPGAKDANERKRKFQKIDAEPHLPPYNSYKGCSCDITVLGHSDEEDPAGLHGSDRQRTMGVDGHLESCTKPARREAAFESSTHPTIIDLEDSSSDVDPPPIVKEKKRRRRHANQLIEHRSVKSAVIYPEEDKECICNIFSRIMSPGKSHLPSCINYLKCEYGNGSLLHDAFGSASSVKSTTDKKRRKSTFKNGQATPNPTPLSPIVNLHDNDSDAGKPTSFIMDFDRYHTPTQHNHTSEKPHKAHPSQPASYNVKTIAGDILRAAGIHQTQPPLNNHVCKGYGQSGFCPLGDSCHFLHARLSGS